MTVLPGVREPRPVASAPLQGATGAHLLRAARLPLVCAALAAAAAALVYERGPAGIDAPAHLFQTWLFSHDGFQLWNNYWYAGRYEFVNYSLLYYPLAALVGQAVLTALSALALAGCVATVARAEWGRAAAGPSVAFAITAPAISMIAGAYPFLAGLAAAAAALVFAQRRLGLPFALAVAVTLAFSPLAFALLVAVLVGAVAGQPRPLAALARSRIAAAALVLAVGAGVVLQRAFPSGGAYPYHVTQALIVGCFAVAGFAVCGSTPRARPLRGVFAAYLVLNLASFLVPGPLGSNSDRLFAVGGVSLLWLAANVGQRRMLVVVPLLAIAFGFQLSPFVRDAWASWENPATGARFWRPALHFLHRTGDTQHRVEVVATWGHWEAYYLAKRDIPLARGWFRQDDFPLNGPLYRGHLTPHAYRRWLRRVGVRYVFLPHAPLDYSAAAEAQLLRSGQSGLDVVARLSDGTVYRLDHAPAIVGAPPGRRALLVSLAGAGVRMWTSAPGRYLLRVRYSPYWQVVPKDACVRQSRRGLMVVATPTGGYVHLSLSPGISSVADAVAAQQRSC